MDGRWTDAGVEDARRRWSAATNDDIALRTYTSRLLGADPRLVLHGGGNTSVKTTRPDLLGRDVEVICVKGSGWDLADLEPPGLPAVRLAPLRELVALDALADEDMVNACRTNLLDASAPTPSVETLLHAFLPHRFVDHTHANAVLALTDQPDAEALCTEVYRNRAIVLPYIMPGFELAKRAWAAQREHPDREGMILVKHGIFSFGDSARESYERMISLVSAAEAFIERARGRRSRAAVASSPPPGHGAVDAAPMIRGLLARHPRGRRFVLRHRRSERIDAYLAGDELGRYARTGVVTPDHVIRTKARPLILADAADGAAALDAYVHEYEAYVRRQNARLSAPRVSLDPMPRVVLVPGIGLFAAGADARAAAVAADLAEATVDVISDAEAIGRFESVSESETFDMEYWSLEQAKLGGRIEPPLGGHVVVVSGAAGTIGAATARAFRRRGAEVALLDVDEAAVTERAAAVGGFAVTCDVTDRAQVRRAIDAVCIEFGGLDIVVSGAGAAWPGRIGAVEDADLRRSFELNFFAHQHVAQESVRVMLVQGIGGVLLFNLSKQAVNPGRDFGPYGLPKAATMALCRQYALDHGADGIRACGVNADRIRSGLLTNEMIAVRAAARGVSESQYMRGNLLGREVTAEDVAEAFVALALARSTTGAVLTVDGGNIEAALR